MTNKATSTAAATAKVTKSAVAKGGKRSPGANAAGNEIGALAPRTRAGSKKRKEPFVL